MKASVMRNHPVEQQEWQQDSKNERLALDRRVSISNEVDFEADLHDIVAITACSEPRSLPAIIPLSYFSLLFALPLFPKKQNYLARIDEAITSNLVALCIVLSDH